MGASLPVSTDRTGPISGCYPGMVIDVSRAWERGVMRIALSLFVLAGITGCPGTAPPDLGDTPDAGGTEDATPTSFLLSGKVMDYFGSTAIEGAMIATD